jgi:hypothetical protein
VGSGGIALAHSTELSQALPNHPAGFLTVPVSILDNGANWLYYSAPANTVITATNTTTTITT